MHTSCLLHKSIRSRLFAVLILFSLVTLCHGQGRKKTGPVEISPFLFGIFFEDLSYAADGGLYAELIQNRSFEYSPSDRRGWHPFTAWDFEKKGYGYGTVSIETNNPVHPDNPHYCVLDIHEPFNEGIGLVNYGYDGILLEAGSEYRLSFLSRLESDHPVEVIVKLLDEENDILDTTIFMIGSPGWKEYSALLKSNGSSEKGRLELIARSKGKIALDMISLFPEKTYKNHANGLRNDLALVIADLKPGFIRFPGGCLVHGDGIDNIYRWKNTIGPVRERKTDRNIWNYHQSFGLGFHEYFRFCEDIGAIPVPVVAAGVSCQNSGGTWRIGGCGQKAIPDEDLDAYIVDILDLIEYANGPPDSEWGSKRAENGHPAPFNLSYLGIGNEDKITPEFRERFSRIAGAVKAKYPGIKIIGTTGPFPDGEDFELGWEFAVSEQVGIVDEHYYKSPQWFWDNLHRYDSYDRNLLKVYAGEYAAHDEGRKNTLRSALAEAAYMTSLERNGDVVIMASYAPLLAKEGHRSWSPDLVYFNNSDVLLTVNYYVQALFSSNKGDTYYPGVLNTGKNNSMKFTGSCVVHRETGDIILKIVNGESKNMTASIDLSKFPVQGNTATYTILEGDEMDENTWDDPIRIVPGTSLRIIKRKFNYEAPAFSLTVIRIPGN